MGLFADILALQSGSEDGPLPCLNPRTLFRSESSDTPQGEKLIQEAIKEGGVLLGSQLPPQTCPLVQQHLSSWAAFLGML